MTPEQIERAKVIYVRWRIRYTPGDYTDLRRAAEGVSPNWLYDSESRDGWLNQVEHALDRP